MPATISPIQRPSTAGCFKKGQSGNPAGKPKGAVNRVTAQARELASRIVDSPEYLESLRARVIAGEAPQMEVLLWAYAKGRPVERVEQGGPGAFATMSDDELRQRLSQAIDALAKAAK
jgi:hypothetical protein